MSDAVHACFLRRMHASYIVNARRALGVRRNEVQRTVQVSEEDALSNPSRYMTSHCTWHSHENYRRAERANLQDRLRHHATMREKIQVECSRAS